MEQSSTGNHVWMQQNGALGDDAYGCIVYGSGNSQGGNSASLFRVHNDHSSSTIPAVTIRQDGTGDIFQALVDGNGDADKAFVIAANHKVGIGTADPVGYWASGSNLVVNGSTNVGMTIASGTSHTGAIAFADGTSGTAAYKGRIEYNHDDDKLYLGAGGSTQVNIDENGKTTFGGTVKGDGDATRSLGATDKRWGTSYITKLAASDGNESNPSHTFQNDLNTGM